MVFLRKSSLDFLQIFRKVSMLKFFNEDSALNASIFENISFQCAGFPGNSSYFLQNFIVRNTAD